MLASCLKDAMLTRPNECLGYSVRYYNVLLLSNFKTEINSYVCMFFPEFSDPHLDRDLIDTAGECLEGREKLSFIRFIKSHYVTEALKG